MVCGIRPSSQTINKNQLKWTKDVKVRPVRLPEENIGKSFFYLGLGNEFFGYDAQSTHNKSKNEQIGLHQTKRLYSMDYYLAFKKKKFLSFETT